MAIATRIGSHSLRLPQERHVAHTLARVALLTEVVLSEALAR